MSRDGAVLDLGRAIGNEHHVADAGSSARGAAATLAPSASAAQATGQLTAQFAPALDVDALVDGFVGHAHHRIVRELDRQAMGDLFKETTMPRATG